MLDLRQMARNEVPPERGTEIKFLWETRGGTLHVHLENGCDKTPGNLNFYQGTLDAINDRVVDGTVGAIKICFRCFFEKRRLVEQIVSQQCGLWASEQETVAGEQVLLQLFDKLVVLDQLERRLHTNAEAWASWLNNETIEDTKAKGRRQLTLTAEEAVAQIEAQGELFEQVAYARYKNLKQQGMEGPGRTFVAGCIDPKTAAGTVAYCWPHVDKKIAGNRLMRYAILPEMVAKTFRGSRPDCFDIPVDTKFTKQHLTVACSLFANLYVADGGPRGLENQREQWVHKNLQQAIELAWLSLENTEL